MSARAGLPGVFSRVQGFDPESRRVRGCRECFQGFGCVASFPPSPRLLSIALGGGKYVVLKRLEDA